VEGETVPRADDRHTRAREDFVMNTDPTYIHGELNLRAGDSDREETADRLRRSHSEGRLDSEEFAARIDRCYDAKTIGELQQLVADLPPARERNAGAGVRRIGIHPAMLLPIVVAAVAVAAIGAHGGFFFVFPILFMARFWLWGRWPGQARRRA